MRILFVSDIYYPHIGGVSEHICNLANHFEGMGHKVSILTANIHGELKPDEERVIRLGKSAIIPANRSCSRITYGVSTDKISRIVNKYDIVHIHGTLAPTLPLLTLMTSRRTNIFTFHPTFEPSLLFEVSKGYLRRYFDRINGKIAVSKTARDSIFRYFPGEYRIIPNGVDTERFTPGDASRKFPKGILPKEILFVGRIEPRKGLQYLIDALPLVKKEIDDVHLTVVGGGYKEMRLRISDEVKDSIRFLGFVEPGHLSEIFKGSSLFVSPAISGESFGIVLIEAMASGVPVIASDIPGYRCVIEDRKNGLLVSPGDHKEIAESIVKIMKNDNLRCSLIKGGLKSAARYSWKKVSKEILDFYYEVNPSLS